MKQYREYLLKEKGVSVRTAAAHFKGLKFFIKYLNQEHGQRTKVTIINEYGELVKINIPDLKYKVNNIDYDKEISVKEVNRLLKVAIENRELLKGQAPTDRTGKTGRGNIEIYQGQLPEDNRFGQYGTWV
nr:hypothetical protein [uncultured Ilyobacter sp.]